MSDHEIIFDDVRYREPERRRRPDRDRRWACLAYEVPGPIDLPIFLDRLTADAIERHALRDTTVELGGILLGKECVDDQTGQPFVWITQSLEAKHYENTQASFTYTHDSWEEITRERDRLHPDLDIVGWYHTHPDFGVFLSSHDLFIHRHFFAQPLQVAYVVDPIRQTRGFFQWRDGGLDQVGGFYLSADRGDRIALARLVNDLENLPNAEGGGGGLSPRLEAELIAMLTRPAHHPATSLERAQAAAVFSLIGALVGVLALAAVLWLNSLNRELKEQTDTLQDLRATTEQAAAAQRLALDTLLDRSVGDSPDRFVARFNQVALERDEARRKLDDQKTINDALAARTRQLQHTYDTLKKDFDEAAKIVAFYNEAKKDAPDLATRLRTLEAEVDTKAARIAELEKVLDTTEGRAAAALVRKYDRTWYVAAAGWSIGLLLGLGLLAAILQQKLDQGPEPAEPEPEGPPPHRIT